MKKIISILFFTGVCLTSFAQIPQLARPATPQNELVFAFRPGMSVVDRIAFDGYAEANKHVNDPDVIFIGDSITQFWYVINPDFFDNNGFICRGIGGQTSLAMLSRFYQDVVRNNPKVVVIMIGTNDVAQNDGVIKDENYLDNIAAACDIARQNGIKVILCSIPPCDGFSWNDKVDPVTDIARLNGMLESYAAEKDIQYVDFFPVLSNGKGGLKDDYTVDRCHPTGVDYNAMELVIVKEINKALGNDVNYYVTE